MSHFSAKTSRPYAAPVISAPSTVKVRYYTDARLVCTITGYPEPTVKWEYSKVIPVSVDSTAIYR